MSASHDFLQPLPPSVELETVEVMRALASANRALAELKGRAGSIPNAGILIDTLAMQEAKASSEIENIVTTQDELFQMDLMPDGQQSVAAKEVARYRAALKIGYQQLTGSGGLICNRTLIEMYQFLKERGDGFRSTPGTALKNARTGEVVYTPPQDHNVIITAMSSLEKFINDDELCGLDPLIKMALIHHQFESIHPFADGNGRIGRILNVLYLTKAGLLDIPILYLSRHINLHKAEYYRLLQSVREEGKWEPWVLYMLEAVEKTSRTTLQLVEGIKCIMADFKRRMRNDCPRLYSQDLLNNLFRHPYTRIEFVKDEVNVSRQTASKYLEQLVEKDFLVKHKSGRNNYYINKPLIDLFLQVHEVP
ncbi:MAG: Fic family protein [Synechococcus sp.]